MMFPIDLALIPFFFLFSFVPKFLPLQLAQVKNGDQQFWKEQFHAANPKAQHPLMMGPVFLGGVFFSPLFPMCFQHVPKLLSNMFLKMFPILPRFYPIWFAQSSTPLYRK
jgi:hypothetical protein